MTELLDKMINRPVQKAVTDVRNIEYIDKGEKLKKASQLIFQMLILKRKQMKLSMDPKKLGALRKMNVMYFWTFWLTKNAPQKF